MPGRVILTTPTWHLSGVNTMNAALGAGLHSLGWDVELLLTFGSAEEAGRLNRSLGFPVRHLPVATTASFPTRWKALAAHLVQRAPCVYLPGYDFDNSTVCPALPRSVATVGVLHSDEPVYFEMTARVGHSWNRVVGVSRFLAAEITRRHPDLASRTCHIPYGVPISKAPPAERTNHPRLRVVIAGRVSRHQKRILDLPPLLDALARRQSPVEITVVGTGADESSLRAQASTHISEGRLRLAGNLPNHETLAFFETQDVILLLSDFEGLPLVLLEAMGRGCIPVVTDIRSGIPDLVVEGTTGFRIPVGEVEGFADQLDALARAPAKLGPLSRAAQLHVASGNFDIDSMVTAYADAFLASLAEARSGASPGRTGNRIPPRHLRTLPRWRAAASGVVRALLGRTRSP